MSEIGRVEIEKLLTVSDKSQIIGEFLEWLQGERRLVICQSSDEYADTFWPALVTINGLLAEFFEIDMELVEKERREILERIRDGSYYG